MSAERESASLHPHPSPGTLSTATYPPVISSPSGVYLLCVGRPPPHRRRRRRLRHFLRWKPAPKRGRGSGARVGGKTFFRRGFWYQEKANERRQRRRRQRRRRNRRARKREEKFGRKIEKEKREKNKKWFFSFVSFPYSKAAKALSLSQSFTHTHIHTHCHTHKTSQQSKLDGGLRRVDSERAMWKREERERESGWDRKKMREREREKRRPKLILLQ